MEKEAQYISNAGGYQSTSMIKTFLMANDSMKITNIYTYILSLVSSCSKQEEKACLSVHLH
jgi:hypothetical protein